MRLTTDTVQFIKAAEGVYRASDVARAYNVHRTTVTRIWEGSIHKHVRPAQEAPDIETKPRPSELVDDIRLLLARGMSATEVAAQLNISKSSVYMLGGVFV